MKIQKSFLTGVAAFAFFSYASQGAASAAENEAMNILRQGLLGAGTGAISSYASGGKAGKGALIGAGTNVIGGALLNFFTGSSRSSAPSYVSSYTSAPAVQYVSYPVQQPVQVSYVSQPEPVYVSPAPAYSAPAYSYPAEDSSKKIIKQGLLGAGVGAISSYASGGKGGQGALIGAGTQVIGGALLDVFTAPPQNQPSSHYYSQPAANSGRTPVKRIVRKFDANGNIISEEEFWQ